MIKTFLPNYTKKIAFALYLVAVVFSCIANVDSFVTGWEAGRNSAKESLQKEKAIEKNISNIIPEKDEVRYTWISLAFSFTGLLMYIFSKEKVEDEYMQLLRIKALTWSIVLTWLAVIFTMIFITPLEGLYVLQFQLVAFLGTFAYLKRSE